VLVEPQATVLKHFQCAVRAAAVDSSSILTLDISKAQRMTLQGAYQAPAVDGAAVVPPEYSRTLLHEAESGIGADDTQRCCLTHAERQAIEIHANTIGGRVSSD
jgi:hypothetical protein